MTIDRLYRGSGGHAERFRFDQAVVDVFDDMVSRSVPLYGRVIEETIALVARQARSGTLVLDLGASTGEATRAYALAAQPSGAKCVGVDSSEEMIREAKQRDEQNLVDWVCADAIDAIRGPASIIVSNYTLQFVQPQRREDALRRVFDALVPGGWFVLSEKLAFEDETVHQFMEERYDAHKLLQGYTREEIDAKRKALRGVLMPETRTTWDNRLERAGFRQRNSVMQALMFTTWMVRK